ncbi:thioredoxin family protein [Alteromonas sp. KUL49]|uniref:thioredoxin family protein n=1 Tax=Alteromonas sp. KUL49 TaxID=2480798 RepID=UPI00102F16BE|nr:thioredoxin family protein [Alteromonas sp. KUL49]TAP38668.1 thioredoxin [Alteromonas sp. KUL49]
MKKLIAVLLTMNLISLPVAAEDYAEGEVTSEQIMLFTKFEKHKDDVNYSSEQTAFLQSISQPTLVKIFFGQWCHDSQREVPRLIQLFEKANNDNIEVVYYGLDTNKSDEAGLAEANEIKKTPTIIIEQNGQEIGRILEFPAADWPTDIEALFSQ